MVVGSGCSSSANCLNKSEWRIFCIRLARCGRSSSGYCRLWRAEKHDQSPMLAIVQLKWTLRVNSSNTSSEKCLCPRCQTVHRLFTLPTVWLSTSGNTLCGGHCSPPLRHSCHRSLALSTCPLLPQRASPAVQLGPNCDCHLKVQVWSLSLGVSLTSPAATKVHALGWDIACQTVYWSTWIWAFGGDR